MLISAIVKRLCPAHTAKFFLIVLSLALSSNAHSNSFLMHAIAGVSHLENNRPQTDSFNTRNVVYPQAVCNAHFYQSVRPALGAKSLSLQGREMCFKEYSVFYSRELRTSLWSVEHLTRDQVEIAKTLKREDAFHPDSDLQMYERAELADYYHVYKKDLSGFDRGHLSPNKDFSDPQAAFESFDLVNIVPQNSDNNEILWEGIESATRDLVRRVGEIYVVTGPIYAEGYKNKINDRVSIPSGLYKAIYDPTSGQAAAYIVDNTPGMSYKVISIASLKNIIGIDVFPNLPDSTKTKAMQLGKPTPHQHH